MRHITRLFALLLFLQSIAVGVASQAVARTESGAAAAAFSDFAECKQDAGIGGKTPTRHAHSHCCILCSSNCSDKPAFSGAILISRADFQAPNAAIALAARADRDPIERSPGWTGSSSSRGPPRFA